jgi:hypothetical protein
MPRFTMLVLLIAAAACTQPAEPNQGIAGAWVLEGAPQTLVPSALTLDEFGTKVFGKATVPGLDPAGPNGPDVSVAGSFSSPAATLDIKIGTGDFGRYAATMDRADHLVGVLTFDTTLGGGVDTLSYVRR